MSGLWYYSFTYRMQERNSASVPLFYKYSASFIKHPGEIPVVAGCVDNTDDIVCVYPHWGNTKAR